jgi:hypothetical protein
MKRSLPNWLKAFSDCVANTEAPEHFWMWGGIYTLGAAMNRNVWLPFGIENLYPNLYIMLIAKPGKCRKGGPISLAKKMLHTIGVNVSVDSTSKEALTKELHDCVRVVDLPCVGTQQQCTMSVLSKEFSSLLAIDAKKMIECLTDLFDDHEVWQYKTKGGRSDKLYNPGLNMFAATTPNYVANNLPYEAFGAGFFSRVLCVVGTEKRRRVTFPTIDAQLLKRLTQDLHLIETTLKGPVKLTEEGEAIFDSWYQSLDHKYEEVQDDRFHGFIERSHVQVLKVAMILSVNERNDLVIEADHIGQSIDLVESIYGTLDDAFAGLGRADLSIVTHMLRKQLEEKKVVRLSDLTRWNLQSIGLDEMAKGIQQLFNSKMISISYQGGDKVITWKG